MSEVTLALVLVMVAAITPLLSLTVEPLSIRLTCARADNPQSNTVQLHIRAKRGDLILNRLDSICFELLPDPELRRGMIPVHPLTPQWTKGSSRPNPPRPAFLAFPGEPALPTGNHSLAPLHPLGVQRLWWQV